MRKTRSQLLNFEDGCIAYAEWPDRGLPANIVVPPGAETDECTTFARGILNQLLARLPLRGGNIWRVGVMPEGMVSLTESVIVFPYQNPRILDGALSDVEGLILEGLGAAVLKAGTDNRVDVEQLCRRCTEITTTRLDPALWFSELCEMMPFPAAARPNSNRRSSLPTSLKPLAVEALLERTWRLAKYHRAHPWAVPWLSPLVSHVDAKYDSFYPDGQSHLVRDRQWPVVAELRPAEKLYLVRRRGQRTGNNIIVES